MPVLAVSALEKVKILPPETWMKIGIALVVVIAAFLLFKRVASMNKVVLAIVLFVGSAVLFLSWVYNRSEPKFLTPVVDVIAPFLPSGVDSKSAAPKKTGAPAGNNRTPQPKR